MKWIDRLKEKAKTLKKEITAVYYAYQHPQTKLLPKIIIFITLGYALSPIDLIPDFIPVLGYLDDLLIIPLLITLSIKLIPKEVMDQSRERAEKEPLTLKDNWLFASLFIATWIIVLATLIFAIIKLINFTRERL